MQSLNSVYSEEIVFFFFLWISKKETSVLVISTVISKKTGKRFSIQRMIPGKSIISFLAFYNSPKTF